MQQTAHCTDPEIHSEETQEKFEPGRKLESPRKLGRAYSLWIYVHEI